MTRWHGRIRTVGLVVGVLAGIAMIVVGCQSLTTGTPIVDAPAATTYRASVSSSIAASSARSAASESARRTSITRQAVHTACDALSVTSVDAVDAVNAFVHAVNENGPGQQEKSDAAVDALRASADTVAASLTSPLPDELEGLMNEWIAAARNVADVLANGVDPDLFNAAVDDLNDVKTRALARCDAAY